MIAEAGTVVRDRFSAEEHRLLAECTHCGFCLPACPTFAVNGLEMDSPRGRLYLMKLAAEGRVAATDSLVRHMDLCLACRGCETVCPSGVQFGRLMEATRAALWPRKNLSALDRLRRAFLYRFLLPSHLALGVLTFLVRTAKTIARLGFVGRRILRLFLSRRAAELLFALPRFSVRRFGRSHDVVLPAVGTPRARVGLYTGCVMDHLLARVHAATARTLRWNGCEVVVMGGIRCCGALHSHAGDEATARRLEEENRALLHRHDLDAIVVNSAGCSHHLKSRFKNPDTGLPVPAICDFSEFLAQTPLRAPAIGMDAAVTYDDPCHLQHAQGITQPPRDLIAALPGVGFIPLEESEMCCGAAGSYVLAESEMSLAVLDRKMEKIRESGTDIVVTANPGCHLQLALGARRHDLKVEILHLAELLDRAYAAEPEYRNLLM